MEYITSKIVKRDKIFVSAGNTPIGYVAPKFPSLYMPVGKDHGAYQASFIYDRYTVWKFTVFWCIFFFVALHLSAGLLASVSMILNKYRHKLPISKLSLLELTFIVWMYLLVGAFKGYAAGAIIGLLLGAVYRAGDLAMSTWIPFCWGFAAVLYDVCSSYSHSLVII